MMEQFKDIFGQLSEVSGGTWTRLILLLLSLINATLQMFGVGVTIPHLSEECSEAISLILVFVFGLLGYWKNNSFSKAAQAADEMLHVYRRKIDDKEL